MKQFEIKNDGLSIGARLLLLGLVCFVSMPVALAQKKHHPQQSLSLAGVYGGDFSVSDGSVDLEGARVLIGAAGGAYRARNGWVRTTVTPLNESGKSMADPAPLLFYQENGKWSAKDLNDVPAAGNEHTGPHDPNPKYIKALQKKYTGVAVGIIPASSHAEDPIATIRARFATINKSAAKYRKVKKELSGFSLEGGELVAYFDGAKLMKMVANHYGEGGKGLDEYYYWDDQLIFIYRKDSNYDRPGSGKVVRTAENRFYFNNGRLIRWIGEDSKQVAAGSEEYLGKEKEYLQMSKELADGARSQKPIIESASTP